VKVFKLDTDIHTDYIQHPEKKAIHTHSKKLDSLNISKFILCFVCISKLLGAKERELELIRAKNMKISYKIYGARIHAKNM